MVKLVRLQVPVYHRLTSAISDRHYANRVWRVYVLFFCDSLHRVLLVWCFKRFQPIASLSAKLSQITTSYFHPIFTEFVWKCRARHVLKPQAFLCMRQQFPSGQCRNPVSLNVHSTRTPNLLLLISAKFEPLERTRPKKGNQPRSIRKIEKGSSEARFHTLECQLF